ncbi:hypothetical protein SCOR_02510 [Sulfidibacter corallicola]|uniref:Uncharacterized protein n=1 Tax=Sulfidibacter corallicola TaxID=2818388 RepID=A0A8A4TID8_SULCO|nr:hypothetical protein [Sulfidibacter corallicola]QTD48601.1 hypothetical protein J3U87_23725 [Sulfidibacter corallicola]
MNRKELFVQTLKMFPSIRDHFEIQHGVSYKHLKTMPLEYFGPTMPGYGDIDTKWTRQLAYRDTENMGDGVPMLLAPDKHCLKKEVYRFLASIDELQPSESETYMDTAIRLRRETLRFLHCTKGIAVWIGQAYFQAGGNMLKAVVRSWEIDDDQETAIFF